MYSLSLLDRGSYIVHVITFRLRSMIACEFRFCLPPATTRPAPAAAATAAGLELAPFVRDLVLALVLSMFGGGKNARARRVPCAVCPVSQSVRLNGGSGVTKGHR